MIAMGEANPNSPYGEYGGMHSSIKDAPDVSGMTIGEVKALQRQKVSEGAKSSAAGRYQIINKSMDKYQQAAGLDDEQPFSPDNQDLMVSSYISKHAGTDPEKIANIAASEFASIKNKNGVGNYDGKLNKAKIERSAIVNAVKQDNNPVDYEAIAKKYGGTEAPVDYEAMAKKNSGKSIDTQTTKYTWSGGGKYDDKVIQYTKLVSSNFSVSAKDEQFVNKQYWPKKVKATLMPIGITVLSICGFFIFCWIIGWVVRGFTGISMGQDRKN